MSACITSQPSLPDLDQQTQFVPAFWSKIIQTQCMTLRATVYIYRYRFWYNYFEYKSYPVTGRGIVDIERSVSLIVQ